MDEPTPTRATAISIIAKPVAKARRITPANENSMPATKENGFGFLSV